MKDLKEQKIVINPNKYNVEATNILVQETDKIGSILETKENPKKFYIESYGCQMNFSDSEIVASVLGNEGYTTTTNMEEADLVFLNTCSIRDKAEETIRKRLKTIKHDPKKKKDVLIHCMD